ncbi:MAG: hypothetical protein E6K87_07505 [Thaumarchaeota archaeon]|nr:MAG: hypothetical protein E6K87_07505 [Nitrososphaerota archaeon]
MEPKYDGETSSMRSSRLAIRKQINICIKCGSDNIQREEDDIVCQECGAVIFFIS